jgi:hypothetical protein
VDKVVVRLAGVALSGVLLGGCGNQAPTRLTGSGPAPSYSPFRNHQVNQEWDEPPGWRLAVTGMRCGATAQIAPGASMEDHVCLVGVRYTNRSSQPSVFSGYGDNTGPTWRIDGYDAEGHDFHGHARLVDPTPPGASGTDDIVFEVPAEVHLRRVLVASGMVDLG